MHGIPSEPELDQCLYCGAWVEDTTTVPVADDDAAWAEIAKDHYDGCEWIATRAHRVNDTSMK